MRRTSAALALFLLCACGDSVTPERPGASNPVHIAMHDPAYEVPDTIVAGRFEISSGCLVFRSSDDGKSYLPVLPRHTSLVLGARDEWLVTVNGVPLTALEQDVRLHGGRGFYQPAAQSSQRQCPTEQMIMSGSKE